MEIKIILIFFLILIILQRKNCNCCKQVEKYSESDMLLAKKGLIRDLCDIEVNLGYYNDSNTCKKNFSSASFNEICEYAAGVDNENYTPLQWYESLCIKHR